MCIAASGQEDTSFAVFSCAHRGHGRRRRGYVRDRVTALSGTLFVCGLFILLGTGPPPPIGGAQTQTNLGPGAGGALANGSYSNGNAPASCFDAAWARAVRDHLQRFFYYPAAARALRARGLVMVKFIMRRGGSLDMVEVSKSSGWWALDETAIDIMRKAQPLPAIPDRMHLDWIGLELPIDFGVRDVHLNPTPGNCG